jgi:hypothetical protein
MSQIEIIQLKLKIQQIFIGDKSPKKMKMKKKKRIKMRMNIKTQ